MCAWSICLSALVRGCALIVMLSACRFFYVLVCLVFSQRTSIQSRQEVSQAPASVRTLFRGNDHTRRGMSEPGRVRICTFL